MQKPTPIQPRKAVFIFQSFKHGELEKQQPELHFPVLVIGERSDYGRTRYKIRPVGGKGERWVDNKRVKFT